MGSNQHDGFLLDYFSGLTKAALENGWVTAGEAEHFRILLSSVIQSKTERNLPLLQQDSILQSQVICLYMARYGSSGFGISLLRASVKNMIQPWNLALNKIGSTLTEKAQVFFNRSFAIYEGSEFFRYELCSKVMIDIASLLQETCLEIEKQVQLLDSFLGHRLALSNIEDEKKDKVVAIALGFSSVDRSIFAKQQTLWIIQTTVAKVRQVLENLIELCKQLILNSDRALLLEQECQWLSSKIQLLNGYNVQTSADLAVTDYWRRNILTVGGEVSESLERIGKQIAELFSGASIHEEPLSLLKTVKQDIEFYLLTQKVNSKNANKAIAHLFSYLDTKKISANALLVGELKKVDPVLDETVWSILTSYEKNKDLFLHHEQKQKILEEQHKMAGSFKSNIERLSHFLLQLFVFIAFTACGIKTALKNPELEIRPKIPYSVGGEE